MVRLVLIVAQVVVVSTGPLRLLDRATRELVKRSDGAAATAFDMLPILLSGTGRLGSYESLIGV